MRAMIINYWRVLEMIRGQTGVAAEWRKHLGSDFAAFSGALLQGRPEPVRSYPCPVECGCAHQVVQHGDGSLVGVCRCDPCGCADLELTAADVVCYELSWPRLGRALCHALGLEALTAEFQMPNTRQIGSWSAEAVPVILTVQSEARRFRQVTAELAARLRQPFILLAPTAAPVDATSKELLANVGAGFFALDNCVQVTPSATLQSLKSPGELFARFQPEAKDELDPDIARRAFGLLEKLEAESPMRPPTVLTVFRLYCIKELSAAEVARQCRCSKTAVVERLGLIRAKTGVPPEDLRRLSAHLSRMEADISDSRAKHIHRQRLIYDEPDPE
jgi:hypothetical protein